MEATPKKQMQIIKTLFCLLKKGIMSKRKLMVEFQLLIKKGKIAGKTLSSLISFNNNNNKNTKFVLDNMIHNSREVEFSFKNYEMSDSESVLNSPMIWYGNVTPKMTRKVRVTDSPFPLKDEETDDKLRVDECAENFIKMFYEQLKVQQRCAMTPKYEFYQ